MCALVEINGLFHQVVGQEQRGEMPIYTLRYFVKGLIV